MKFKKVTWNHSVANSAIWNVDMPFNRYLEVMFVGGSYKWEMHDLEEQLACGRCNTLQKAMEHAERAYQKYVTEHLERIVEEQ